MALADCFLKLDGIKGESADSKHKGEIEIQSFSWGVTQAGTFSSGGGGGAGKASFQDIHFSKHVDVSSPLLALACASGQHIKAADLVVRKAGGDQQDYYKVKLTDVLVSSYQSGGTGSANVIPTDQFSLNFAKVEFSYAPQDEKGKLQGATKSGWDLKQNKKA